jgi:polysaccharide biosynthesis/export protein
MRGSLLWLFIGCALVVSASVAVASAAEQCGSPPSASNGQASSAETYRIGPEDLLLISVWKNDQMTRQVPVRPDGKISLPLLNDVQAAGLTALDLRKVLAQKLVEFIPSPEVSVIVLEVRSFKVSVMGEVARPGRFELKSWATVVDVLAMAGGFTQFATRSKIVVIRTDGSATWKCLFNYNKLAGEQDNFYLRNGDVVLVP